MARVGENVMDSNEQQRLFQIKDDGNYFRAGYLRNGHQVLMGVQSPELVMVDFDIDGTYLSTTIRSIVSTDRSSGRRTLDPSADMLFEGIEQWMDEIRLMPRTITVKEFFLEDRYIGIRLLPDHYQDVLEHPDGYDRERLTELTEDIRSWTDQGSFVLFWTEDYYMSREGDVDSS